MTAVRPEEREAAMLALRSEANNLLRVHFLSVADGVRLLGAVIAGDQWSRGLMVAITDCIQHIATSPRNRPALCLTCPQALRRVPGVLFCVVVPETSGPRHGLGSAICPRCAQSPDLGRHAVDAAAGLAGSPRDIGDVGTGDGTMTAANSPVASRRDSTQAFDGFGANRSGASLLAGERHAG